MPVTIASCCSDASLPPLVSRGHLGDVRRRDDARDPDPDATNEAPEAEVQQPDGQPGAERRREEEDGGHLHGAHPTDPVGDHACVPGACGGADQSSGGGKSKGNGRGMELSLDRGHSTVDHGGVEPEQEAPDRRNGGDQDHPPGAARLHPHARQAIVDRAKPGLKRKLLTWHRRRVIGLAGCFVSEVPAPLARGVWRMPTQRAGGEVRTGRTR